MKIYVLDDEPIALRGSVKKIKDVQSEAEISGFFMTCDSMPYDCHVPKRNIVFPAMYRLMYCCGLRCKEARTLKCENVVLNHNYIDILQSKGPKSRRIFISDELSHYLDSYNESVNRLLPNRVYFFPSRGDSPYSVGVGRNRPTRVA